MENIFERLYKPDVLSCLADLSNDEVFTPPEVANKMLDLLPQELFRNKETKILDPACKSGVFLREAAKRFIAGERDQFDSLEECLDWIFKNQLYGIAITELTSLLSRRSIYCSKYPNSPFSIVDFGEDDVQGNIMFHRIQHNWVGVDDDKKCSWCGASAKKYERPADLETHAYEWIHTVDPEDIWNMKFDVIISNPPYQLSDGGNNASAIPIYHKFIEQAKKLNPRYMTMIIPSRWYAGGRGLDKFRNAMLADKSLRELYDYANSDECFPGVDISGGICYFLWDREYSGKCKIVNIDGSKMNEAYRDLDQFPILIRSNLAVSVVEKILSRGEENLAKYVSPQRPFGLRTYARPDEVGELTLRWNGGRGPLQREKVTVGEENIDKWNVIVSRVFYEHGGKTDKNGQNRVLSILELLGPKEVCSETYVVVMSFDNQTEAENLYNYLKTKFARFMILQATSSIMITKNAFIFLPVQDFKKPWNDEALYSKYNLTEDEIDYIESVIRPMELSGGDE